MNVKRQEKLVLFLCGVIMKKLGWVMKQMVLLKDFLNHFKQLPKRRDSIEKWM